MTDEEQGENKLMKAEQLHEQHEYALRDAAARFEETRRLAAELAMSQEELKLCRMEHVAEISQAAEREVALSGQLSRALQDARDSSSREVVELGARVQVADWRTRQIEQQAEDYEEQRRRAIEAQWQAEANAETMRSELLKAFAVRDALQSQIDARVQREVELEGAIEAQRNAHAFELEQFSHASSQAIGEATSEMLAAQRAASEARRNCERAEEAQHSSELRAEEAQRAADLRVEDAQRAAAAEVAVLAEQTALAAQRTAQAEATLEVELEKLLSDRATFEARIREAEEAIAEREKHLEEEMAARLREANEQLANLRAEHEAEMDALRAEQEALVEGMRVQLEAERKSNAEAADEAHENALFDIAQRSVMILRRRACKKTMVVWYHKTHDNRLLWARRFAKAKGVLERRNLSLIGRAFADWVARASGCRLEIMAAMFNQVKTNKEQEEEEWPSRTSSPKNSPRHSPQAGRRGSPK